MSASRAARILRSPQIADVGLWVICTYTLTYILYHAGFEGPWYRLEAAMKGELAPPFTHRVLFVMAAQAVQWIAPEFHPPRCYFITQILAGGAALWLIRIWAKEVAPRYAVWSQPMLVVMLAPTFTYWTFYDIGIVAFVTACLLALVRKRYGWYLALFALGTFNHENIVILLPVAFALRYRSLRPRWDGIRWLGVQLLAYGAVRLLLFWLMPVDSAWQPGKLAYNAGLLANHPGQLVKTAILGLSGLAIVATRWQRLPYEIVVGTILVPELILVTVFIGQLNELRQFDAAIPVILAGMLHALGGAAGGSHGGPEDRDRDRPATLPVAAGRA